MVAQPRFVANVRERERDEEQRRSDINKKDTARRSDEVGAALSNMEQKSGFGNHLNHRYRGVYRACGFWFFSDGKRTDTPLLYY
ncbi:MAG: hypothetical protein HYW78_00190 [Parcubacteria group bacterium]|nr:hypothetical protein [Parcubacteria group bacterium]